MARVAPLTPGSLWRAKYGPYPQTRVRVVRPVRIRHRFGETPSVEVELVEKGSSMFEVGQRWTSESVGTFRSTYAPVGE